MKNCLIFSAAGNTSLVTLLANKLKVAMGLLEMRHFPDGETYLRIDTDVTNKNILLVGEIDHPNDKLLPLMFLAQTLKELGAKKIFLISPYLPYMRQDKRFKPGEAVTSRLFAHYLSGWIDGLITIDPHLHRIKNLADIFTIESISVLHAATKMAEWIRDNIEMPLIIGPDAESQQWVAEVAKIVDAPYVIIQKTRYDDSNVSISIPEIKETNRTPVLVDDIISTGASMQAAIQELIKRQFKNPVCIGVHALFNNHTYDNLIKAGAQNVITCNTILHPSNKIDISDIIVDEIIHLQSSIIKK